MTQERFSRFVLLTILLLLFGVSTHPVKASGIEMKVNIGFNGYVIPERWAPLLVHLSQRMNDVDLEVIKIDYEGRKSPVEIFSVINRDQLEIPMYMGLDFRTVKIRLCKDGFCLAEQNVNVGKRRFPGHLILALNVSGLDEQAIERVLQPEEPVLVVPTRFFDLPGQPLSYDGISRIIMNDPGIVLTPGQSRSLHSWITSGGRLVIFTNRTLSNGIIANLGISNTEIEKVRPTVIPVGLGTVKVIPLLGQSGQIPGIRGSGRWLDLLDLKSFTREAKIHINQYIPDNFQPKTQSPDFNLSLYVAVIVALWAFTGLIFILLTGFHWPQVGIFTVIALILMVPAADWLRTNWHRGVDSHIWAVVLPNQGGVILHSQIGINHRLGKSVQVSPWGAGLSVGKIEVGELNKKGEPSTWWRHQSPYPLYLNQSLNQSFLDLTGWFPEMSLRFPKSIPLASMNFNPAQRISIQDAFQYDRHTWLQLTHNGLWVRASSPKWLDSELKWRSKMENSMPDVHFMVGRGRLPSSVTLSVEGFPLSEVYWIMPLLEK